MSIDWTEFWRGNRDVSPFLLGAIPFGLIAGLGAVKVGYPADLAIANSAIVFAGTSQLAAIQLVELGSTIVVIWITTFFVNIRMMMYSITLAPYLRTIGRRWQLLLAYLLVDQAFAFSILRFQKEPDLPDDQKKSYFLGIAAPLWVMWLATAVVGALLGAQIPESWSLDFTIPLAFLALIIPNIKDLPTVIAGAVSSLLAVALSGLPFNMGLVVGITAGMAAGRLSERFRIGRGV